MELLDLQLEDVSWPYEYTSHDRTIVRAIVYDKDGYFYFVQSQRNDDFGNCTNIETSGGGVEENEELTLALKRELKEELGAIVEIESKIGVVSDYYNLIHRHNINHYYLCRVTDFIENSLTEDEKNRFHLTVHKVSYKQAVNEYEQYSCAKLGKLIYRREMPILLRAKELLDLKEL